MDLQSQYTAALFPDQWRVCGRLLRPLSLGAAALLHRIGSPYADLAASPSARLGDLVLGVWICERPWQQAAAGLRSRRCAVTMALRGHMWARRDWLTQRARFLAYLSDAWHGPKMWRDDRATSSAAPMIQSFILHRMMHLHQSFADAMDTSLKVAMWDKGAWAESSGVLTFMEPEVEALLERQRADSTAGGCSHNANQSPQKQDQRNERKITVEQAGKDTNSYRHGAQAAVTDDLCQGTHYAGTVDW